MSNASVGGSYLSDVLPAIMPHVDRHGAHVRARHADRDDRRATRTPGLASGLFNTSQQVGGALGLAVLSTLAANKTADVLAASPGRPGPGARAVALVEGYNVAFMAAAILVAVTAPLLLIAVRKRDVPEIDPSAAPVPAG